jgi:hypothetical protein
MWLQVSQKYTQYTNLDPNLSNWQNRKIPAKTLNTLLCFTKSPRPSETIIYIDIYYHKKPEMHNTIADYIINAHEYQVPLQSTL